MFCKKCGTTLTENNRFCPVCGEPAPASSAQEPTPEQQPYAQPYVPTVDLSNHTADFTDEDRERTHILAALCYFNLIFAIIGLLAEPSSKFLRYHINQAFIITVFAYVCVLVAIIPILGWIISGIGGIAIAVFSIMEMSIPPVVMMLCAVSSALKYAMVLKPMIAKQIIITPSNNSFFFINIVPSSDAYISHP